MDFSIIIPARFASTRFPEKILAKHRGRTLLSYTYQQALLANAKRVIIATDHASILAEAHALGAEAVMTSVDHASGTDRLAEVAAKMSMSDEAVVVNWQADEPLLPPAVAQQLGQALLAEDALQVATLSTPMQHADELMDANVVKVVRDATGRALYFSRAPMPWDRDGWREKNSQAVSLPVGALHHRHIGMYAYRAGFLKRYATWEPAPIEQLECLEQLRILWHGECIRVLEACAPVPGGVDALEDWQKIHALLPV